jgi:hypothetical protein
MVTWKSNEKSRLLERTESFLWISQWLQLPCSNTGTGTLRANVTRYYR